MLTVTNTLVLFVAALHIYFLVLEMFLWTTPFGLKTFRQTKEQAENSKVLAANQGLYNGFLAAGLVWGVFASPVFALQIQTFFLTCIVVAALYGAATVNKQIFFIQGLPALLSLCLVFWV